MSQKTCDIFLWLRTVLTSENFTLVHEIPLYYEFRNHVGIIFFTAHNPWETHGTDIIFFIFFTKWRTFFGFRTPLFKMCRRHMWISGIHVHVAFTNLRVTHFWDSKFVGDTCGFVHDTQYALTNFWWTPVTSGKLYTTKMCQRCVQCNFFLVHTLDYCYDDTNTY